MHHQKAQLSNAETCKADCLNIRIKIKDSMSNYTHRPTEEFCTEVNEHTFELIKAWAKENEIGMTDGVSREGSFESNRWIAVFWHNDEIWGTSGLEGKPIPVPLTDFIAKFKTPEPKETDAEKRERLISELTEKVGGFVGGLDNLELYESLKEIQSLKPKS